MCVFIDTQRFRHIYREREIERERDFKESAQAIVVVWKAKFCRGANRLEIQEEPALQLKSEGHFLQKSLLFGEVSLCSIDTFN